MCYWISCKYNVMYHKYYMFMYGFYLLSISIQKLKKNCSMDKRNGWIYNEIQVSNKWKCMAGLGIQPRDPCITRKVLYHWATCIQANLYLWFKVKLPHSSPYKVLPLKKLTTCSACQDLIDLTKVSSKMVTAPNVNEKK